MKLTTGLNPYGLTYYLGLQGMGTPRHNPNGAGLEGFIALTEELGGKAIELWEGWFKTMSDAELAALKARLDGLGWKRVLSSGLQHCDIDLLIRCATALDAKYIRLALTPILCGDRAAAGQSWHDLVRSVNEKLEAVRAQGRSRRRHAADREPPGFHLAASWSASATNTARMCGSSSTWPTPSRSPSRRSISPA